jgi:hypothetical protein
MYLPTKIGEISNVGGVTQIWSDEELAKLTAMGDAIAVDVGSYQYPQHHAHNLEDAMRVVGAYRKISGQIGWHCVFRGQTRDYYVSDSLAVLPAIARSNVYSDLLKSNLRQIPERVTQRPLRRASSQRECCETRSMRHRFEISCFDYFFHQAVSTPGAKIRSMARSNASNEFV